MPILGVENGRATRRISIACLVVALVSCGTPESRSARDARLNTSAAGGRVVTQAELQQDIERFATRLMEADADAVAAVGEADTKTREEAVRLVVRQASSSLDIASGPAPEIALLDMIVFVSLSRHVLDDYWVPVVFGDRGVPLARAFADRETELWKLSSKVLGQEEQAKLRTFIDDWIKANPDRIRVETTRLSDFSLIAGRLSEQRAKEAGGLFGAVKSATVAADDAVLLGQRAMFVVHRMPFLIRLQARLGASEVLSDSIDRFGDMKTLAEQLPGVQAMLANIKTLVEESKTTAVAAQASIHSLEPVLALLPPQRELQETIHAADHVTEKADALLRDIRALVPANPQGTVTAVTLAADQLVRRWAIYLALIGAVWSVMFWGGYYAVKRLTAARSHTGDLQPGSHPDSDFPNDHRAPPPHH